MVTKAFVFVTTSVEQTKEVLNKIKKLDGVKSVDFVMGPYDILAVVEGDSIDSLGVCPSKFFTLTCETT